MSKKRSSLLFKLAAAIPISLLLCGNALADLDCDAANAEENCKLKEFGKQAFFDKTLSGQKNMGCVTCHDPDTGGKSSISGLNLHDVVHFGSDRHTHGNVLPMTNIYAFLSPPFHACNHGGLGAVGKQDYCGGNFWNGRAPGIGPWDPVPALPDTVTPPDYWSPFPGTAKHIGEEIFYYYDKWGNYVKNDALAWKYSKYFGPTADQALNPMPNKVEQDLERLQVCQAVKESKYAPLYKYVWGEELTCDDGDDVPVHAADVDSEKKFDIEFKRIMLSICAWQASKDLNTWSSRRDVALFSEMACVLNRYPDDPRVDDPEEIAIIQPIVQPYYDYDFCYHVLPDKKPNHDNWGKFAPLKDEWGHWSGLVLLTEEENLGHHLFYNRLPIPFLPQFDPTKPPGPNPPPDGPPNLPFNVPTVTGDLPLTNCSFCHSDDPGPVGPGPRDDGTELKQIYTAQDFHHIGLPFNPEIPVLQDEENKDGTLIQPNPDLGIESNLQAGYPPGFFRTQSLRNVCKIKAPKEGDTKEFVKAFMHNGYFNSGGDGAVINGLADEGVKRIVHFYNTMTVDGDTAKNWPAALGGPITRCPLVEDPSYEDNPFYGGDDDGLRPMNLKEALANNCWPEPEFTNPGAFGTPLVGDLGMTDAQEDAVVSYLCALTDQDPVTQPKPYKDGPKKK